MKASDHLTLLLKSTVLWTTRPLRKTRLIFFDLFTLFFKVLFKIKFLLHVRKA